MGTVKDSQKTREKIIAAAGELFADHGYHGVTVRDIIQKAKTHQSALNYHFSGKESLYREVLLKACESPETAKLDLMAIRKLPSREALHTIVGCWIRDYTIGGAGGWKAKLVNRECLEPSSIFQEVIGTKVLPEIEFVAELLGRTVGRQPRATEVRAAVLGLLGQVTTLTLYRQLLEAVASGLYAEIHQDAWLQDALTDSMIAFVDAVPKGKVKL